MGYTTEFDGSVSISPPLNAHEIAYLRKFAASRRMDRARGPYFVDGSGPFGQGHDDDIRDFNKPPAGQPGLWCWWEPTKDGTAIKWNGVEKFYNSEEWMTYLIDLFLKPAYLLLWLGGTSNRFRSSLRRASASWGTLPSPAG
jgi:hypothetical protein